MVKYWHVQHIVMTKPVATLPTTYNHRLWTSFQLMHNFCRCSMTFGRKALHPKSCTVHTILAFYRRGTFEYHDYMFGIIENYHCWRFHGSGVMQGFEIVGNTLFGTRVHLGHVLRLWMCFRVFNFLFENTEIRPCTWCMFPRRDSSPLNDAWVHA